jgi:AmmeMemoRadiSam system protein A
MSTEFHLTNDQKKQLLDLARRVVETQIAGVELSINRPSDPALCEPCGCFVTLHVDGQLRGCIGTFQADDPLYVSIVEMAKSALQDPRFLDRPIRTAELEHLEIEISVLSPLTKTDDPLSLTLGKHGIYIRRGYRSGCFLPQVATETGWSKEEFLGYCCGHKAGLPVDAWKDPKTDVYLFTAEVFSEKEFSQAK